MRRSVIAIAAAALVGAVLAWPATAKDVPVSVQDNEFVPKSVEIVVGDKVIWTHEGSRPHTVTADDGSWDSNPDCPDNIASCMVAGQRFERQFSQAGTFPYYCKLHGSPGGGGMAGVVVVKAATAATQPPPPPPTTAPPATNPPATSRTTAAPPPPADESEQAAAAADESTTTTAADVEATLEEERDTTSTTLDLAADVEPDDDGGGGAPVGLIAGAVVILLGAAGFAGWRYWPRAAA